MTLLAIGVPRIGRSASTSDEAIHARVVQAFEDTVRDGGDSSPPQLHIERAGYSWSLTASKDHSSAPERLTCLLCTTEEAAAAAEFLGRRLARGTGDRAAVASPLPGDSPMEIPAAPARTEATLPRDTGLLRGSILRTRVAAVAAGLGIAAAVTGGIFLSLNGECASADCEYKHYLKTPGIALIATGAGLVTAAILLWRIKHSPSSKTEPRGAP